MDRWDRLAILFGVLSVGAVKETFSIVAENGWGNPLSVMAGGFTVTLMFFTFWFFLKKKN